MLSPLVRRSLAPRGQTPIIKEEGAGRQKVSVIAALSLSPKARRPRLLFESRPRESYNATRTAAFLKQLLSTTRGRIILLWDNAPHHRARLIRDLAARHRRLHIAYLPPYAPDLNPVELLWSHLKWSKLANAACRDAEELNDRIFEHMADVAINFRMMRNFYKGTPLQATLHL